MSVGFAVRHCTCDLIVKNAFESSLLESDRCVRSLKDDSTAVLN